MHESSPHDPNQDAAVAAEHVLASVAESMAANAGDIAILNAQISELQALLAGERAAIRHDQRESLVRAAALQLRAADPADVIAWAERDAPDALAALVDADGSAQPDAARSLVEACRTARPHYFRSSAPGVPSNAGAFPPPTDRETLERALNGRRLFSL
ncbi:MAG: hypothetical protein SGI73_18425 [Chloroflexota bacterium]|nr:hypothetical protein [Chloroflexota bacterium]